MSIITPLAAAYAQSGGVSSTASTARAREARAAGTARLLNQSLSPQELETVDAVELHDDSPEQDHSQKRQPASQQGDSDTGKEDGESLPIDVQA